MGAIRRNTLTVLRLEVTAEFIHEGLDELHTIGVWEDATCVAGFGGLASEYSKTDDIKKHFDGFFKFILQSDEKPLADSSYPAKVGSPPASNSF